ncbi:MAG: hypothetical protein AAF431_07595 [Pseudomonadota bacterium]
MVDRTKNLELVTSETWAAMTPQERADFCERHGIDFEESAADKELENLLERAKKELAEAAENMLDPDDGPRRA